MFDRLARELASEVRERDIRVRGLDARCLAADNSAFRPAVAERVASEERVNRRDPRVSCCEESIVGAETCAGGGVGMETLGEVP